MVMCQPPCSRALALALSALAIAAALPPGGAHGSGPDLGRPVYREVTVAAGLGDYLHAGYLGEGNGPLPVFPEITGPGACWLDYDRDGWLDLYLVNGLHLTFPEKNQEQDPRSMLYRNRGDGTFADVSNATGAVLRGNGQGCAAGDYDNDGDPDLVVTQFGGNVLLRNDAGAFVNATATAGVRAERCGDFACWGSSASWWDFDRDGCLDLLVDRFGDYDPANPPPGNGPEQAPGQPNALFRGDCQGRFVDVAAAAGMTERHNSWGSVSGDFDEDGWPDLFVANDGDVNDVYLNRGDGTFDHVGFDSRHGMGIAHGDANHDGHLDVVVTNFVGEKNTILLGDGDAGWVDIGSQAPFTDAHEWSGWAAHWFDAHNDGHPELMVLNGMTEETGSIPLAEPILFYENDGAGGWGVLRDDVGYDVTRSFVARGGAWGDHDNDGDVDFLLAEAGERRTHLFRADDAAGAFLSLDLVGTAPGVTRDAVGARVRVLAPGLAPQLQEKVLGSGFLGSNDPRLHFGLGRASAADVQVTWPDGSVQSWPGLRANAFVRLTQGQAVAEVQRALPLVDLAGPARVPRLAAATFTAAVQVPPGAGPVRLAWDLGDGATAEGPTATHAFRDVGDFVVRVVATDGLGRSKAQALRVRVEDTLHAEVVFAEEVFNPWERLRGHVAVRYANGDPVRGARVQLDVTYASGSAEVDAAAAGLPPAARDALGYRAERVGGNTSFLGRYAFALNTTVHVAQSHTPLSHPGVYTGVATGGHRGFAYDPATGVTRVGAASPLFKPNPGPPSVFGVPP